MAVTNARPVDWPVLIDQLRARGLTSVSIADSIQVSDTAVREWRLAVKTPSYNAGEALVDFWCRFMEREREEVPRVVPMI